MLNGQGPHNFEAFKKIQTMQLSKKPVRVDVFKFL